MAHALVIASASAAGWPPFAQKLAKGSCIFLLQWGNAGRIHPVLYSAGVGVLLALFVAGLVVLLAGSFKISASKAPKLVFSSAWILFYLVGQTVCVFLAGLIHPAAAMDNFAAGGLVGSLPVLVALLAFQRQPWGAPFHLPLSLPWKQVGLAAAGFFLVMAVNASYVVVYALLAGHPPAPERSLQMVEEMMRSHPALTFVFAVLIGPLVEETLFRGLLFGSLEKHLQWRTIPVTAVVFGAFHLDLVYFFPVTVLGLLLGWARWKSGSIWLSVILHTFINGLAVFVLWLKLKVGL
jgi:membrane protease YdiL (CAAX protease family)